MRWTMRSDDDQRALYATGRADATARRLARLWAAVFGAGLMPRRWVTLEVVGRSSGQVRRFPLGMADWEGEWYLVSMLGEDCHWVRNVQASDGHAVLRRRRARPCLLVEVPVDRRPPILRRYLQTVPGARPHLPLRPDAPLEAFTDVAASYPAFRVDYGTTQEQR